MQIATFELSYFSDLESFYKFIYKLLMYLCLDSTWSEFGGYVTIVADGSRFYLCVCPDCPTETAELLTSKSYNFRDGFIAGQ